VTCSMRFPRFAISVNGDCVERSVSGAVVASHEKRELVATGKLKFLGGVYGR
jgi:hypothetical protein